MQLLRGRVFATSYSFLRSILQAILEVFFTILKVSVVPQSRGPVSLLEFPVVVPLVVPRSGLVVIPLVAFVLVPVVVKLVVPVSVPLVVPFSVHPSGPLIGSLSDPLRGSRSGHS